MSDSTTFRWVSLLLILLVTFAFGSYWLYSQWKQRQIQALEVQISKQQPAFNSEPETSEPDNIEVTKLQQLIESGDVARQSLEEQNKALLAELDRLTVRVESLQRLKRGRAIVNDFISQFLQYEPVLGGRSFFDLFQDMVVKYSETQSIPLKYLKRKGPLFEQFRQDMMTYAVNMSESDIQAVAEFVGFHFVERAFHLPLTLAASRLIIDIEAIDFEAVIFVSGKKTKPQRDSNGELILQGKAEMLEYSQAQQFFFRRGPKFSQTILVFLKSYLEVGA